MPLIIFFIFSFFSLSTFITLNYKPPIEKTIPRTQQNLIKPKKINQNSSPLTLANQTNLIVLNKPTITPQILGFKIPTKKNQIIIKSNTKPIIVQTNTMPNIQAKSALNNQLKKEENQKIEEVIILKSTEENKDDKKEEIKENTIINQPIQAPIFIPSGFHAPVIINEQLINNLQIIENEAISSSSKEDNLNQILETENIEEITPEIEIATSSEDLIEAEINLDIATSSEDLIESDSDQNTATSSENQIENIIESETASSTENLIEIIPESETASSSDTLIAEIQTDHVVISEVKISGLNLNDEFIEFYNPTNNIVNLGSWSLQYRDSQFTSFKKRNFPTNAQIQPKGYIYSVQYFAMLSLTQLIIFLIFQKSEEIFF